jgi:sulfonate transport system permease protein
MVMAGGIQMVKGIKNIGLSILIPVVVVIAWSYVTSNGTVNKAILPTIQSVFEVFVEKIFSGQLVSDLSISLTRVVRGYFFGVLLGVFLGTIMGISDTGNQIFSLTLNAIRQIPMMAWIPLIILWCGIGELSKTVIIILGAFFPIMVNTFSGIRGTQQGYIEVARLYKLNRLDTFHKVYLPSATPQIFVGLKLGLGISWMAVVAAELMASTKGIGYRISNARSLMQPDIVIMGMIIIGTIGVLMDKVLTFISKRATPWTKIR